MEKAFPNRNSKSFSFPVSQQIKRMGIRPPLVKRIIENYHKGKIFLKHSKSISAPHSELYSTTTRDRK
jgi:hypothetical protein